MEKFLRNRNEMTSYAGILVCIVGIFVIDIMTPLGFADWLLFMLPLLLSFRVKEPLAPLVTAVGIVFALVAGYFLSGDGINEEVAAINRVIAGTVMTAVALTGRALIIGRNRLADADWVQQGEVDIARAVQGELTPAKLADQALEVIGSKLGVRAAVVYERAAQGLERVAVWGADASVLPRLVPPGTGHLWRAVTEDQLLEMKAQPETALGWMSGLLQGRAAHSAVIPLRDDGYVNAVLELGLDGPLRTRDLRFLDRVSDKMGIAFRSALYRTQLQELLEETRRQAEELRSHTEELAATNEELEEQTQALKESQRRLEEQQSELEEQNSQLETQTQELEEQRDALVRSRQALAEQSEKLAMESRYKSEFVANMSHELRTPLNALLIMSRLLAENRSRTLSEEQIRWAQTIESSGKDLLALINDILDLSKIEAGRMDVSVAEVEAETIARKLVRGFEVQAKSKGLLISAEVSRDAGVLHTDEVRLEQILRNFLSNAVKFTEQGKVTLSVKAQGDKIAFAVKDTGIGIAATEQDNVFEAFRQADGTISRKYGGTGLGLSISRELADLLGGTITLESMPGKGSTFTLVIPRTLAAAHAPQTASLPPSALQPTKEFKPQETVERGPLQAISGIEDDRDTIVDGDRVLLAVEDDPAFARVLYELAHELNFKCVCVGRADDAIRAARAFLPQAIVLDVGLPDHSGLTVLDQLKRDIATRHIPVHMVSADDYTHEALSQGAISYMLKPVQRVELASAMQKLERRLEQSMRSVLIVEDDEVQLEGLQALLGTNGIETVGATTAAEALTAFRQRNFDCIVLDMTLPDASGFDLLEQLASNEDSSFPPVIVYTARALSEAEEQRLRRYSRSIIIKGAKSPERLIDEVTLFLHQVVSDLPEKQREMLAASLNRDALLEGRRILVVEDDIRNIYALTGIFEPHGATVQIARNGREALDALGRIADGAQPKVDLVLMDVMMPEMDGLTATREIRKIERWKNLPIIMLTAKAMAEDENQCLASGANDYLPKPVDVDRLLSLTRVWMPR